MAKVLISDKMDPLAAEVFQKNGVEVDVKTGMSPEELKACIGDYDGLAIRSSTTVTPEILQAAKNLKVIGRAGIGTDNIDKPAATAAGVIVMNTPFGNSITTAEHAIAMMFACARDIAEASVSTHAGKWEKSKFMGVELYGKTLGVIGCGNIGSIVANRALGLQMKVLGFDPYLTEDRAKEMGIEKVELNEIYKRSDFITLHVPKNDKTLHMIDKDAIAKMKDGVRIVNCARGGLIVEQDLKDALDSGKVAAAALDVFEVEPAKENVLFGHAKVTCTPHLGASTKEAQVNVALQVAEQISAYLNKGAVENALNTASISAEDAPKLKPYLSLSEKLGLFAGQITEHAIKTITIEYLGPVSKLNVKPLTATILSRLLSVMSEGVNMVNAPEVAKNKGIIVSESLLEDSGQYHTAINVIVKTEKRTRNVMGSLFAGEPRIVNVEGVRLEAALGDHMIFVRNDDTPGFIGHLGTILGQAGCNISDFNLGRVPEGAGAIALVSVDVEVSEDVLAKLSQLNQSQSVISMAF